jgi:hypothetical protein
MSSIIFVRCKKCDFILKKLVCCVLEIIFIVVFLRFLNILTVQECLILLEFNGFRIGVSCEAIIVKSHPSNRGKL